MIEINSESSATIAVPNVTQRSIYDRNKIITNKNRTDNVNFAYSFRPIYFYSRILGLMPFSISYNENGRVQKAKIGVFDGVWFVISICTYLSLAFTCFHRMKVQLEANVPFILFFGEQIHLALGLAFGALAITIHMYNRSKMIDILRIFSVFDEEASFFF